MGICNYIERVCCAPALIIFALVSFGSSLATKPNIILMIADDLGIFDLGCYGNTTLRTPNIDSLARDGVQLKHNLATASVCTPSRAALLTGRHQIRTGMAPIANLRVNLWQASRSGLPETEITLAEVTRQAGYRNALIGKWHLGVNKERYGDHIYHPLNQGFDYFYGLLGTNLDDYAPDGKAQIIHSAMPVWYAQLFIIWSVTAVSLVCLYKCDIINLLVLGLFLVLWSLPLLYTYWVWDNFLLLTSFVNRNYDIVEQPIIHSQLSKKLVRESIEFMDNATQSGKPFLLVNSWIHTHVYLDVSEEFKGRSKLGIYGDAIEELDWSVGEVLKHLDKIGARENTLVYFTSDHGGHLELGPLGGYNGILKGGKTHGAPDGGIRVPGLVRWSGVLPTNTIINKPTSLMDVFHLVSSVAGVPLQTDRAYDGRDILPLLTGDTDQSPHEFMYHYCGNKLHAVRYIPKTGSKVWKLVSHEPRHLFNDTKCQFVCGCNTAIKLNPPKLYDMTSDPGETTPIDMPSSEYSHVIAMVEKAIKDHKKSITPVPSQFTLAKLVWRPSLQPCCNGTFPYCECTDTKYTNMF